MPVRFKYFFKIYLKNFGKEFAKRMIFELTLPSSVFKNNFAQATYSKTASIDSITKMIRANINSAKAVKPPCHKGEGLIEYPISEIAWRTKVMIMEEMT